MKLFIYKCEKFRYWYTEYFKDSSTYEALPFVGTGQGEDGLDDSYRELYEPAHVYSVIAETPGDVINHFPIRLCELG